MLADGDHGANALGCMPPDPEAEPSPPRDAEEMRPPDVQLVEHGDDIGDAKGHRIRVGVVRLVAPPVTPMVDEDEPEFIGRCRERLRDGSPADELDRIEEATEDQDGGAPTAVVLENQADTVTCVRGV